MKAHPKPHILFVDDDPLILDGARRALGREPYTLSFAGTAHEAFAYLDQDPVDIIISDYQMPQMLGTKLLNEFRARSPQTIRIMLTGQARLDVALEAINSSEVFRFLMKPLNHYELTGAIAQALQYRELVVQCQRLLTITRRQSSALKALERENPGITKLERSSDGVIQINDPVADIDSLIDELRREIPGYDSEETL